MTNTTTTGQTAPINGMQMYYEIHGQGEPLVLLHGFTGAGSNWQSFIGDLAREYQLMRQWHQHGDAQIRALWMQGHAFKDSYDDMNFTPPYLSTITARTLIVHGDRDPIYPVSLALEMYQAIPQSYLWVIPNGGH